MSASRAACYRFNFSSIHHVFEAGQLVVPDLAQGEGIVADAVSVQEIETWVQALGHYDNNEFEESLKTFDNIADTSKILFNCGVIHATLGEHEKAVSDSAKNNFGTPCSNGGLGGMLPKGGTVGSLFGSCILSARCLEFSGGRF